MTTNDHADLPERVSGPPFAILTVVAIALSFFLALGRAPLFDVDEGAFSQATLEMFQRGDFRLDLSQRRAALRQADPDLLAAGGERARARA